MRLIKAKLLRLLSVDQPTLLSAQKTTSPFILNEVYNFVKQNFNNDFDVIVYLAHCLSATLSQELPPLIARASTLQASSNSNNNNATDNPNTRLLYNRLLMLNKQLNDLSQDMIDLMINEVERNNSNATALLNIYLIENNDAAFNVANFYFNRSIQRKDKDLGEKAITFIKKAIRQSSHAPKAYFMKYEIYKTFHGFHRKALSAAVELKYEPALEELKRHAKETKDPESLYDLGMIYLEGKLLNQNNEKAADCFERSNLTKALLQLSALILTERIKKGILPILQILAHRNDIISELKTSSLNRDLLAQAMLCNHTFRRYQSDDQILHLLDCIKSVDMTIDIIVLLILERNNCSRFFNWLLTNNTVLEKLLANNSALARLRNNQTWQTFIQKDYVSSFVSTAIAKKKLGISKLRQIFLPSPELLHASVDSFIKEKTDLGQQLLATNPANVENLLTELNQISTFDELETFRTRYFSNDNYSKGVSG